MLSPKTSYPPFEGIDTVAEKEATKVVEADFELSYNKLISSMLKPSKYEISGAGGGQQGRCFQRVLRSDQVSQYGSAVT